MSSIDFHAHHSPQGAWFTFTCGALGAGGGPGLETGEVPKHRIYIGWAEAGEGSNCHVMPFLQEHAGADPKAAYTPEQKKADARLRVNRLDPAGLKRDYGFATDRWTHGPLSFALHTPVVPVPEPGKAPLAAERAALLPAIAGELVLDNRHGSTALTLFFALGVEAPSAAVPLELGPDAVGFSWRNRWGVAARRLPGIRMTSSFSLPDSLAKVAVFHRLCNHPCIAVPVPAGATVTLPLAIGAFVGGTATVGIDLRYRYADFYAGIEDVLASCLARHAELSARAARQDAWLAATALSADRRLLLAHATRSYWYSNQALMEGQVPVWVVNEGEYAMTNTFDLTVDHAFYESMLNPWVLRSALDMFADRYSYVDQVVDPVTKAAYPGGISFCHDMGVNNVWSERGHSSYEVSGIPGCFSYMTAEQLDNWILCATTYVVRSGDSAWLREREPIVRACLRSLQNRDHHDPAKRTGLTQFDSSRVVAGAEITTYDSLDHSLAQARNNLYMGVKNWAGWLGLELLLGKLGDAAATAEARAGAVLAARTIAAAADPATGIIPAIFEPASPGAKSAIIPAIEGLAYPRWWGLDAVLDPKGPYGNLITALDRHLQAIMKPGVCLFPDGGWKLSSTSGNSWMSKIMISQHVADRQFGMQPSAAVQTAGDAAHVKWQVVGSRLFAASDQCIDGEGKASKYYPRLVTAWLWLDGALPPL